jgi:hypothetical protein
MPSEMQDIVVKHADQLEDHQIQQLKEEVGQELDKENNQPGYLGMKCDVANWKNFYNWLLQETDRRNNKILDMDKPVTWI